MAYRARVYLHRTPDSQPEYLGDLDQRPVRGRKTSFTYKGKHEAGQIESLVPPAWESLGVIPPFTSCSKRQEGRGPASGEQEGLR